MAATGDAFAKGKAVTQIRDFSDAGQWLDWLCNQALPLWSQTGFDPGTGLVFEALDHQGNPMRHIPRRFRVQARQAYVFALCAPLVADAALAATLDQRAQDLFHALLTRGFDPQTGLLVQGFDPQGKVTSVAGDLYDLAFVFLACSAGLARGFDLTALLGKAEAALALLKAERGWHENAAGTLPRRQNPHMHLFEAAIEMARVTGRAEYRAMADDCLALFKEVFLQPDGRVFEFFAADWSQVPLSQQAVEPGHIAEWVGLLRRYETVFVCDAGVDLTAMFQMAERFALSDGLQLPDAWPVDRPEGGEDVHPSRTLRLWPQTEWIKAHCTLRSLGHAPAAQRLPLVLAQFAQSYLNPEVQGGWFDQRDAAGRLISTNMPASTMYHIVEAIFAATGLKR